MAKKRIPQGIIGYGSSLDQFSPERLVSFPSTNNFAGRFIQLTTDGLYYKRNEANNGWDTVGASLTGYVKADGTVPFTANQGMGGFKLTGLLAGTNSTDAINKSQLDYAIGNAVSVDYSTTPTTNLVGSVLNGVTLALNDIFLGTNGLSTAGGGLYKVQAGSSTYVSSPLFVSVKEGSNWAFDPNTTNYSSKLLTKENIITAGTTAQYFRGDKTFQTLDKTAVGLANVPNTDATARANHTGTQLASTISDFNAAADARIAIGTAGLYDDRGNYNASVGTFPTTGGSGSAGAINKGDVFLVSVAGTLGGVAYSIGDSFRALVDTPGQTAGNWASMKQGSTLSNVVIKNTPTLIGNASLTVIPVTHNLNTYNVKAIVRKVSDNTIWDVDPTGTSVNIANLDFGAYVPASNEFEVVMFA